MKKCPYCNSQIQDKSRFCFYCMTSLEESQFIKTTKDNGRWWIYIISAVLVVALAIGSGALLSPKNTSTSVKGEESSSHYENAVHNSSLPDDEASSSANGEQAQTPSQSESQPHDEASSSANGEQAQTPSQPESQPPEISSNVSSETTSIPTITGEYTALNEKNCRYSIVENTAVLTDVSNALSGSVVIPESLGGYPICAIGESAFRECDLITAVSIPNGVTEIERGAFMYCSNLKTVILPEGLEIIGASAFALCVNLETINLPKTIKSIKDSAFERCFCLANILIPNGVTEIGNQAFLYCQALEEIEIPSSVTSLSSEVFYNCDALKKITIGADITSAFCFLQCYSLETIIIKEGVTTIAHQTFHDCDGIKNLYLPKSLTNVYNSAFNASNENMNIWYAGSQADRESISIGSDNDGLVYNANWKYNSKY